MNLRACSAFTLWDLVLCNTLTILKSLTNHLSLDMYDFKIPRGNYKNVGSGPRKMTVNILNANPLSWHAYLGLSVD